MKDPVKIADAVNPQFGHMEQFLNQSLALPDIPEDYYFNVPSLQHLQDEYQPEDISGTNLSFVAYLFL